MKVATKIPVQKIRNAKKKEDKTYIPEEEIEEDEDDADTYEIGEEEEEEDEEINGSTDEGSDSHEEEIPKQTKSLEEEVKNLKKKPIKKSPPAKASTTKTVETNLVKVVDNQKRGKKRKMEKAETSGTDNVLADSIEEGETVENETKKEKREPPIFNDKNVDYNLYNEAPENVATKKIKLSSNIILMCKMIEGAGDSRGLSYDYAALSIIRKTKNNKAYECNLPLTICPNLIKGIEYIMKENKHFFQK